MAVPTSFTIIMYSFREGTYIINFINKLSIINHSLPKFSTSVCSFATSAYKKFELNLRNMIWYGMLFYKCRYHVCIKFLFTPTVSFLLSPTVFNVYTRLTICVAVSGLIFIFSLSNLQRIKHIYEL